MTLNKLKFLFSSCLISIVFQLNAIENFDFRSHAMDIAQIVIKEMEDNYDLDCIGTGGSMPNDLEAIELCFVAYRKGSVKEAREIEVRATQRLTELINQDKKLYPFLREFPFPTHRVEISLSFRQPDDSYYSDGSLAYTFQVRGILRYKVNNPKTDKFVFLHQEPFEEAQKIIKSDGNNTFAKKLSNKSECTSIQYEKASSKDDSGKDYDIMSNTMQNALKERINKLNVQYGLSE